VQRGLLNACFPLLSLALSVFSAAAQAEQVRVATYNTELGRNGPALLLRDILRGEDPQIAAVVAVIAETAPDILVLQSVDYDYEGKALSALAERIRAAGVDYPHLFARRPNTGLQTGLDLDGDGRRGGPRDAQGYGRFSGAGGMAILSRWPIAEEDIQDYSEMPWRDLPDALRVTMNGAPFPSAEAEALQRLSTTAHWVVPVEMPQGRALDLLTFHASPPVFDGPEDRNGLRNSDEIRFWTHLLDGRIGKAPEGPFVILGDANNDPEDGEGLKPALHALLSDARLQDPRPQSPGSVAATGDPFDTVDWTDPVPGNLRVSYILPSAGLEVVDSGVYWPAPGTEAAETAATASRHRLVWVDLKL
jgi:endonuclease/exonuclease/phosphatase family metal-dependent hydrolase